MPNCPCLRDMYCCGCGRVCSRERDGHMVHEGCKPKDPGKAQTDIPPVKEEGGKEIEL